MQFVSVMVLDRTRIGAGSRMSYRGELTGSDLGLIEQVLDETYRDVLAARIVLVRHGFEHGAHDDRLRRIGQTLFNLRAVTR